MIDSDHFIQKYKQLEKELQEQFHQSPETTYFVVSKNWLNTWKQKYGYQGLPIDVKLAPINTDIATQPKVTLKYCPIDSHPWQVIMNEGMVEGKDYEIVSPQMWEILKKGNKCDLFLERQAYFTSENKKVVQIYLDKIKFAPLYPTMAEKFHNKSSGSLIEGYEYVASKINLKKYVELLQTTLKTVTRVPFMTENSVRLYKCPPDWTYEILLQKIMEQVKTLSINQDISILLPEVEYLNPEKLDTFEDCQFIPEQIMIMDAKESRRKWIIRNALFEDEYKCDGCYNFRLCKVQCECKKVFYCSEECRNKDEYYHQSKCTKLDSDEEKINALCKFEGSRNGICGLRNLGNTCFMNSGLQCLSNTWVLTEYFLNNHYKEEINLDNPLGSKGQLITRFTNLIKKMWFDSKSSIAPHSFKKAIGELQPQFQGYQQHDSQELITFLLDGIHEDLNRIKKKPYIETPDSDGKLDHEVAKECWEIFKKRNDSVIVDNMYGMYRSQLECPTCKRISIAYDPYLMVNVSIPQDTMKVLNVTIQENNKLWNQREETFEYDKKRNPKLRDILKQKQWFDVNEDQIVLTCATTYSTEDVFIDDQMDNLKKKIKFRKLFLRRMTNYEINVHLDNRLIFIIHNSYQPNQQYSYKKDFIEPCNFIFDKNSSFAKVHIEVFNAHYEVIKKFELYEYSKEDVEVIYQTQILNKFYSLEYKNDYNKICPICNNTQSHDYCKIPFDDTINLATLNNNVNFAQSEIHLVWQIPYKKNGRVEDVYDDWKRFNNNNSLNTSTSPQQYQQYQDEDEIPTPPNEGIGGNTAIPLPAGPVCKPQKPSKSKNQHYTLQECLKFSQHPEQLEEDNAWYCKTCKQHVLALKTMQIYIAPKILIYNLKRFKDSHKLFKSKLETNVEFPLNGLDMTDFLQDTRLPDEALNNISNPSNCIYDLYAVTNHYGGLGGGHYTAYCKNHLDGKWYNFDDSKVTEIYNPEQTIVGQQAYVLFYVRRDQTKIKNDSQIVIDLEDSLKDLQITKSIQTQEESPNQYYDYASPIDKVEENLTTDGAGPE